MTLRALVIGLTPVLVACSDTSAEAPADGATVDNPDRIESGIDGMQVVKAGDNQPDSGDHLHIPHNPPLKSAQITITVE